ncbi:MULTISPECIES: 3-oxoadipate enol-lactonase [unclassified Aureimonas]|uniref:bifunctional 3-oxoadipate enol-lactonase/4-carboxymuconolactone decarboxylase PcaDC n=1 Tax=unclassified Aureimonas TaxID=2615206 RepID=UPI0006F967EE|nr:MULTISPECIES: 3-oxoadipate enol-lactonase [unclassified Aureimonas]KQT61239.1 3-oxoadipate enol-lactonase [Aureimonas sp. Leaf460]KQT68688.1 3-oxoadipate enol-lactonase [Aureimonas sp. Leaf427]
MAFAEIDGIATHYRLGGMAGGRRVMFLNSLGSDLRIWGEVETLLAPTCEILTYDMRGHGLTEAAPAPYTLDRLVADAAGLLDAVGWETASLVGLSVGGLVAQGFALHHPERLASLVLMDTAAKIGTADGWNERIAAVEAGGTASIADAVVARWVSPAFATEKRAVLAGWRSMLAQTSAAGYAGICAALRDADLTGDVPAIVAPTLVLVGDGDLATPPDLVEATARLIPGAEFRTIPGAGHLPCLERPAEVAGAIANHLQAPARASAERGSAFDAGMAVRRAVLGDAHVDRATAAVTAFDAPFQRFITEGAWGTVWSRPHFTRRERSIVTIALLAALGHDEEVAMHVRATRNTGAAPEDIAEALMHVAVYAGVPAANHAIKIAKATLAGMGKAETDRTEAAR